MLRPARVGQFTVSKWAVSQYRNHDRQGANLFFQLVSRRYERGSIIIITSNQSLGAWGEVFGDAVIASAILDRLLHHSITVNIKGESFRLREKLRAGLLKPKLDHPLPPLSPGPG